MQENTKRQLKIAAQYYFSCKRIIPHLYQDSKPEQQWKIFGGLALIALLEYLLVTYFAISLPEIIEIIINFISENL
jgi:hypothetical protein